MKVNYLFPTQQNGISLFKRQLQGEVVMLNLLHFREIADYSAFPEQAPLTAISGKEAFQLYIDHTLPFLQATGGDILFLANAGEFFIGPLDEYWDAVMLVKQKSIESFMSFAENQECMKGNLHRTAALLDSRLLPMQLTAKL
ncbi:DUF1330 domain-containing protein [Acinetobacter rudis]|uniref:DUF1330 domain-containing protein n=1 Tax=Acinetobacter rudis TaxID=632955 RepID=A0AAW8JBK8_9GAMM|nr:DUF1330 domain-containing protein [Acinetobacter rudis]MDQ8936521.1 DUF1330 domain-containing protein [Acinetobacter rudis]MDQ9018797.1 DUF1330 domain-containing protein [Acinetobacter rudis]